MRPGPGFGPTLVALEGASGSGKSEVARRLAERNGWTIVSEAYERLRPRPSLAIPSAEALRRLERRLLHQDALRFASATLATAAVVVLDTGVIGPLTYVWALGGDRGAKEVLPGLSREFGRLARGGAIGWPDLTFYLDAPATVLHRRVDAAPATHPAQFADRHARVGQVERKLWLERLGPRLGRAFVRVDATRSPEHVTADVERRVQRFRPTVASRSFDLLALTTGWDEKPASTRRPPRAGAPAVRIPPSERRPGASRRQPL